MKLRIVVALISLLTSPISLSWTVQAQETNSPPPNRPQPPGRAGLFLGTPAFNVLTDEQRRSILQAMQGEQAKVREIQSRLGAARRELLSVSLGRKFDEEVVRKQALAVANLEAELTVIRMKAVAKVQPPLSPEQIEKIKSANPASPQQPGTAEPRPGRRRILQDSPRDANDLPLRQ